MSSLWRGGGDVADSVSRFMRESGGGQSLPSVTQNASGRGGSDVRFAFCAGVGGVVVMWQPLCGAFRAREGGGKHSKVLYDEEGTHPPRCSGMVYVVSR